MPELVPFIYVIRDGSIWRISKSRWATLQRRVSEGKPYNLDDYGRYIGEVTALPEYQP